jgi:glutathione gamma-glutamylcysteinyltransferase
MWRWFDESMLDCCVAPEEIKVKGVPLPKLACLARCNGACCTLKHADVSTEEEFRRDVIQAMRTDERYSPQVIIVSYSRPVLNQSGSGHFSPLGAYNSRRDMVLIMDVARFKYPAHWVPLKELYKAMMTIDKDNGLYRGYLIVSRGEGMNQVIRESCECTVTGEPPTNLDQSGSVSIDLDPDATQTRITHFMGHQCSDCCGRTSC